MKRRWTTAELKDFLDEKVERYNRPDFIPDDPVSVPHRFSKLQDIEIAGLFAAVFSWGQRVTILRKSNELMDLMEHAPHEFILHHTARDLKRLLHFRHRTFQATDLLYFIDFLQRVYRKHRSLETAFTRHLGADDPDVTGALNGFYDDFCAAPHFPQRTKKHISSPQRKSTCKRMNMYLRWMVRRDGAGVDFGLWKGIRPDQLVIPLDLHVGRVASRLRLLDGKAPDWGRALALTSELRKLDPADPVKYDFALFSLGIYEKF